MTAREDESELVGAARGGDAQAFGVLVGRYQDRLYPMLVRMTEHPEDARDLLQEAFLLAFRKLDRFEGTSSFFTWLYRLAVNVALSDRRRRRLPLASGPGSMREPIELGEPSSGLEREERVARVQEALGELAPEQRAVIVMKDLDGLRYDEIAAVLRVPVGTVRSRLHRARLELKERLQDLVAEEARGGSGSRPGGIR